MTNADRIRAMSDEELIKFLYMPMREICPNNCETDPDRECSVCIIKWLRQDEAIKEEME